ncbi:hypothetical protein FRC0337_01070 [Corynebacterium diphtheriae]|nr:hypothetical protein FRC0160_01091 [Corynebacterium diphtheriae]CAB0771661.1 hypothetical protein FRC0156_01055 [Corynebacterium diphtheriae]CAB0796045.1 hypothetical protein FRC0210_01071 [Corynebacterium diphtheriae]CAB0817378.1 hypothetical protein FRC0291_01123 [Corynebacterium diphtheriae]CAB0842305.1 hypothetical protein FRC0337_01070 [Corynebacterium diphtheriae]
MKRNKRVIASAALSVSLATSGVAPVAWADEMHVKCPQEFHGGSDFDGDVNAKVGEHLQPNCELATDQISRFSIRDEKIGETMGAGTGGEQQSEPLKVNAVKAGDREITGSVFVLPGKKKTVQVTFPNARSLTQDLQLDENSGEEGNAPKGKVVTFKFKVPEGLDLKAGHEIFVIPLYGKSDIDKPVKVIVQPADVVEEEGHGSERPEGSDKPGAGSEGSESPGSGESESEFPFAVTVEVNDIKEGDNKVTGKVRLYPGQEVKIEASFPSGRIATTVVKLEKKATKTGQVPEGEFVPFEIDVPSDVKLREGHKVSVSPIPPVTDPKTGEINVVEVIVKAADKVSEPQPEQTPDNGKGKGKEGDNGSTKPAPPSVPGADDKPSTGKGSLSFGSIFGVIAGLGGVVALVMSVVKFFNQNSDVARFLQPLRNFFSLFKF